MISPALRLICILFVLLTFVTPSSAPASSIDNYKAISLSYTDRNGTKMHAIRSFLKDGIPHYLLVDRHNLDPSIVPASGVTPQQVAATGTLADCIAQTTAPPIRLQNHGLHHALRPVPGMILTVDLCPSKRPFEKGMFEALCSIARNNGKPVPVAICISGAWLSTHPDELSWLKGQERGGLLAITWVNHSLSHFYDPGLPLELNFLLSAGTNQRMEILGNEIAMLQAGISPSPFFRFPGLISDERTIRLLAELSLIPLGADAWLAKGEMPRDGSIILVHGNGNEPPGITKLMKLIQGPNPPLFLPLAKAAISGSAK